MCNEHVSVDMDAQRMHLIWVSERLGASSRRPRHPFTALMAGVNPGRVPVHRALPATRLPRAATVRSHSYSQTAPVELLNLPTRTSTTSGSESTFTEKPRENPKP